MRVNKLINHIVKEASAEAGTQNKKEVDRLSLCKVHKKFIKYT